MAWYGVVTRSVRSEVFSVQVKEAHREEPGFSLHRKMENCILPFTRIKS